MSQSRSRSPHGASAGQKQTRRANSCLPCRESKSKCTGGIPCATCQKKRQKPLCRYRDMTANEVEAAEIGDGSFSEQDEQDESSGNDTRVYSMTNGTTFLPNSGFLGSFSVMRTVDEYKRLLPAEGSAQEAINSIQSIQSFQSGPADIVSIFVPGSNRARSVLGPDDYRPIVTVAAVTSLPEPLQELHARYLTVQEQLDSGMVIQAWTSFPHLVREAEILGLDREDNMSRTSHPGHDVEMTRRMWWSILELDARLSFLLGRPTAIRHSPQTPQPSLETSEPDEKDMHKSKVEFTEFMMNVLASLCSDKPSPEVAPESGKSVLEKHLKQLQTIQQNLPQAPQKIHEDVGLTIAIAEHQFEVHLTSLVLNCHVARRGLADHNIHEKAAGGHARQGNFRVLRKQVTSKQHKEILQSARRVVEIFDLIHTLDISRSALAWTHFLGVYCAAAILGIARLRQEVELDADTSRVDRTQQALSSLYIDKPDFIILQSASASLARLLENVHEFDRLRENGLPVQPIMVVQPPSIPSQLPLPGHHGGTMASSEIGHVQEGSTTNNSGRTHLKRPHVDTYGTHFHPNKRSRYYDGLVADYQQDFTKLHPPVNLYTQETLNDPSSGLQGASFGDMMGSSFQGMPIQNSFEGQSFPASASSSFGTQEALSYPNMVYTSANDQPYAHPPVLYPVRPPEVLPFEDHETYGGLRQRDAAQQSFYVSAPSVPDGQHLNGQMHAPQQQLSSNGFGSVNHPHLVPHSIEDVRVASSAASNQMNSVHARQQQDTQLYLPTGQLFQHGDHAASSPLVGDGTFGQAEAAFTQNQSSLRRRSVADIGQQQSGDWTIETPANFIEHKTKTKTKAGNERTRSPTRDSILSPISGSQPNSRRNSATPRQIARQSQAAGLDHGQGQGQGQMSMQRMDSGEYVGSRRQSLATITDATVAEQPRQANPMSDQRPREQVWQQRPPPPPSTHNFYDPGATMHYEMNMNDHSMAYSQHYNQQMPPRHVATTGPFTGEHGHQYWTG